MWEGCLIQPKWDWTLMVVACLPVLCCSAPAQRSGPVDADSTNPLRPQSERARLGRQPGSAQIQLGKYNPVTHTWDAEPDPELIKQKQRQFDRMTGQSGLKTGILGPPNHDHKPLTRCAIL
jgi:hypothetical protein